MSGALVLRTAVLADARPIAAFHTDCWNEAYRGMVPQDYLDRITVEDREIRWHDRLTSPLRQTWMALRGDHVVGVASSGRSDEVDLPALELMSLYVAADHRGGALAEQLLSRSIGSAPAHLLVFEENRRAQAFYRKHRFRAVGHRQLDADTGIPEVRMVRP
jgi:ribosomal protein S18 acetylase RimI-like enzyme